jgi:hypothetical protein
MTCTTDYTAINDPTSSQGGRLISLLTVRRNVTLTLTIKS